jgi:hypothetical protein
MFHEQSRPDRDQHVIIFWENIQPGAMKDFEIKVNMETYNMPYDLESVMHYGVYDFVKADKLMPTILPNDQYNKTYKRMGQRDGLSDGDVYKLRTMYKCTNDDNHAPPIQGGSCSEAKPSKCKDKALVIRWVYKSYPTDLAV